jgi:hypothetical protein
MLRSYSLIEPKFFDGQLGELSSISHATLTSSITFLAMSSVRGSFRSTRLSFCRVRSQASVNTAISTGAERRILQKQIDSHLQRTRFQPRNPMVSPIVLGFNDGIQVYCQVYPDNGDGHAASSSKTYDLLGRAHCKRAAGGQGFSGRASGREQGVGATNAQVRQARLFRHQLTCPAVRTTGLRH